MEITWDLFVLLAFAVTIIYGALLGRNRILGILVNTYIGIAVATVIGEPVYNMVSGVEFISRNLAASVFGAKMLVLVIVVAALSLRSEIADIGNAGFSRFQGSVYGFLTAGLILSSAVSFMSDSEKMNFFNESNFVNLVAGYHAIWIVAPVLVMVGATFLKGKR